MKTKVSLFISALVFSFAISSCGGNKNSAIAEGEVVACEQTCTEEAHKEACCEKDSTACCKEKAECSENKKECAEKE